MKFKQFNDYETSTIFCPCGASMTWSGYSERLKPWQEQHLPHVTDPVPEQIVTEDGKRAGP